MHGWFFRSLAHSRGVGDWGFRRGGLRRGRQAGSLRGPPHCRLTARRWWVVIIKNNDSIAMMLLRHFSDSSRFTFCTPFRSFQHNCAYVLTLSISPASVRASARRITPLPTIVKENIDMIKLRPLHPCLNFSPARVLKAFHAVAVEKLTGELQLVCAQMQESIVRFM